LKNKIFKIGVLCLNINHQILVQIYSAFFTNVEKSKKKSIHSTMSLNHFNSSVSNDIKAFFEAAYN
jgi:predicted transcriptional regulator YheO